MKKICMKGNRYGRLVVLSEFGRSVNCRCDCGEEKVFIRGNVLAGYSNSCGCLQKDRTSRANTTHGGTGTELYRRWKSMHARCYNKNSRQYQWYGARGIEVCARWHNFTSFLDDMEQGYAPGLTLDRIDSSDDYYKENCRWLTKSQNASGRP